MGSFSFSECLVVIWKQDLLYKLHNLPEIQALFFKTLWYQVTGAVGVRAVWPGVQGSVEVLWPHNGDCCEETEAKQHWGRQSQVSAGGSHHGTVQSPQCGEAVWCGHYGRTCEWFSACLARTIISKKICPWALNFSKRGAGIFLIKARHIFKAEPILGKLHKWPLIPTCCYKIFKGRILLL